jgi:hypothetical protein
MFSTSRRFSNGDELQSGEVGAFAPRVGRPRRRPLPTGTLRQDQRASRAARRFQARARVICATAQ